MKNRLDQLIEAIFGDVPEPCFDPECAHCHPDGRVTIDISPAQIAALDLEYAEPLTKVIQ